MDVHGRPVLKRCQTHGARSDSYCVCVCERVIFVRDSWDGGREWSKRPARGQLVISDRMLLTEPNTHTHEQIETRAYLHPNKHLHCSYRVLTMTPPPPSLPFPSLPKQTLPMLRVPTVQPRPTLPTHLLQPEHKTQSKENSRCLSFLPSCKSFQQLTHLNRKPVQTSGQHVV